MFLTERLARVLRVLPPRFEGHYERSLPAPVVNLAILVTNY